MKRRDAPAAVRRVRGRAAAPRQKIRRTSIFSHAIRGASRRARKRGAPSKEYHMTTGLFTITAVALAAALSACAASAPSPQLQGSGSSVRGAVDCGYDQDIFDTLDAVKLPKNAFCSPP
jgi:hypothetical protein